MLNWKLGRRGFLRTAAAGAVAAPQIAPKVAESLVSGPVESAGPRAESITGGAYGSGLGDTAKTEVMQAAKPKNQLLKYITQRLVKEKSRKAFEENLPEWFHPLEKIDYADAYKQARAHFKSFRSISAITKYRWTREEMFRLAQENKKQRNELLMTKHKWALAEVALGLPGSRERVLRSYAIEDPDEPVEKVKTTTDYHFHGED